ncbi:MAG: DinB family protein [Bacteroidetes bacterium]|nr:DinB family protein [Bacteroidota bacterium]MCW5894913.1 DinB family protein [Bacteroidota bacterium]
MNAEIKEIIWRQFGAAIDMLENAIDACPESLWGKKIGFHEFWYIAFHSVFYLDLYLAETDKGFLPPPPFTLDELDERGLLPDRIYTKQQLKEYLTHGRAKCRSVILSMTEDQAKRRCGFDWLDLSVSEVLLYNMRHVQHHAAQLNLLLSRAIGSAPRWVRRTELGIE